jgi:hypothetical protein
MMSLGIIMVRSLMSCTLMSPRQSRSTSSTCREHTKHKRQQHCRQRRIVITSFQLAAMGV